MNFDKKYIIWGVGALVVLYALNDYFGFFAM